MLPVVSHENKGAHSELVLTKQLEESSDSLRLEGAGLLQIYDGVRTRRGRIGSFVGGTELAQTVSVRAARVLKIPSRYEACWARLGCTPLTICRGRWKPISAPATSLDSNACSTFGPTVTRTTEILSARGVENHYAHVRTMFPRRGCPTSTST
ncbi:hypothetical protein BDV96DRAFT_370178 [Lophiotrema nucula]|uniref:Uncharacterized protein n=1 Tax=Lophiotrema nucula TaxID=690887 RepID=A0A6A5ZIH2_9PLEO|nr:hypothetical protein BDV96DRAFT_370178 [Lophiotrema nucula]